MFASCAYFLFLELPGWIGVLAYDISHLMFDNKRKPHYMLHKFTNFTILQTERCPQKVSSSSRGLGKRYKYTKKLRCSSGKLPGGAKSKANIYQPPEYVEILNCFLETCVNSERGHGLLEVFSDAYMQRVE
jgi:hypothetical protein